MMDYDVEYFFKTSAWDLELIPCSICQSEEPTLAVMGGLNYVCGKCFEQYTFPGKNDDLRCLITRNYRDKHEKR